jgi:hypothetical protein
MNKLISLIICLLTLAACSSPAPQPELDPVIVVLCADPDPEQPPHPCCSGFVLDSQIVTANHCAPSDTLALVTRRQWVETSNASEVGTVARRDNVRDIAWVRAAVDSRGLALGAAVASGDAVRVLTSRGVLPGTVGAAAGAFWLTDIDSAFGDSGSAVVDAAGNAVGVLSRCLTADGKVCDRHSGIFSELPQ